MTEAVLSSDDDIVSHAEKESVFDDAAAGVEFRAEFLDLDEAGYQAKVRDLQEASS